MAAGLSNLRLADGACLRGAEAAIEESAVTTSSLRTWLAPIFPTSALVPVVLQTLSLNL